MDEKRPAAKDPAHFFLYIGRSRTTTRMAEGIAGSWTAPYRQKPIAGTVEVAGGNAFMQTIGKRCV